MIARPDPRLWLRVAALALLAAALAVPPLPRRRPVYDVIALLDITASMNTADVSIDGLPARRIAFGKAALHALLAALPCGSRLGVGIFVEKQPFLLFQPVETCANYPALDEEIAAIDWRMGWDSESHIAQTLVAALRLAAPLDADLLFLTDGQETPPLAWSGMPGFAPVRGIAHGVIEGIGGERLVPIPRFDSNNHPIGVFKPGDFPDDADGRFAGHGNMTALDSDHLRQLAALSGLAYRTLADPQALFADLRAATAPRLQNSRLDLGWAFAGLAAALLLAASVTLREHHSGRPALRA